MPANSATKFIFEKNKLKNHIYDIAMQYKKLTANDASDIALVHYQSFPDFFLTSLGSSFLSFFYKGVLANSNGLGIGIYINNELIGFAIGTTKANGFYKSVLSANFLTLAWAALPALIKQPSKIKRLLKSFSTSGENEYEQASSLLSICILPAYKSKGFGALLIKQFEDKLKELGIRDLILTTDSYENDQTNLFYKKNNYACTKSFLQGKRMMNLYYKNLEK